MVKKDKKGGWKIWPTWAKGSGVGLILAIIFSFYILMQGVQCVGLNSDGTSSCPTGFEAFKFGLEATHPFLLFSIVSLIILGAFVGWIVGKIKSGKIKK